MSWFHPIYSVSDTHIFTHTPDFMSVFYVLFIDQKSVQDQLRSEYNATTAIRSDYRPITHLGIISLFLSYSFENIYNIHS